MADIDWIDAKTLATKAPLGLMSAPGYYSGSLEDDLEHLRAAGVETIVNLLPDADMMYYGVFDSLERAAESGFEVIRLPIEDGGVPEPWEARELVGEILKRLDAGKPVALHCIGGIGRTGTIAACLLIVRGFEASEAIKQVRSIRSGAIETSVQEFFIDRFAELEDH